MKKYLSLIFLCLCSKSMAIDQKNSLPWFSSNERIISNAPCKSNVSNSINLAAINSTIFSYDFLETKGKNESINGVAFTNESLSMLEAFRKLTTAYYYGGVLPDKQRDVQLEFEINPSCDKVLCAVEKIWGINLGHKILYTLLKYHFNTSELGYVNKVSLKNNDYTYIMGSRFTEDMLDDVLLGLEDLYPYFGVVAEENQPFVYNSQSQIGRPNTIMTMNIILYEPWLKNGHSDRQYSVFHELSHNLSKRLGGLDFSPDWMEVSGLIKEGLSWKKGNKYCAVSEYGKSNSFEHFAESVSSYRYNGQFFKNQCPEIYNYIKEKVFKNIEFIELEQCLQIEPVYKIQNSAKKVFDFIIQKSNYKDELITNCSTKFVKKQAKLSDAKNCYQKILNHLISDLSEADIDESKVLSDEGLNLNATIIKNQIKDFFHIHPEEFFNDSIEIEKILTLLKLDFRPTKTIKKRLVK